MAIDQDLNPLNLQVADAVARATELEYVETVPGQAYAKVLWTSAETGAWAAMVRWAKGYQGPAHKHFADAHTLIMSGSIYVDGNTYGPGDHIHEPNGIIHLVAKALEDTEFFFLSNGPVFFFEHDEFVRYVGWEEARRLPSRRGTSKGWV